MHLNLTQALGLSIFIKELEGGMERRGALQFERPSKASASFPLAISGHKTHPRFGTHLDLTHLWSWLAAFFFFLAAFNLWPFSNH